jgi:hypothetical protein
VALRLPFRVSISLAFVLITAPLVLAIIGTLYLRNPALWTTSRSRS